MTWMPGVVSQTARFRPAEPLFGALLPLAGVTSYGGNTLPFNPANVPCCTCAPSVCSSSHAALDGPVDVTPFGPARRNAFAGAGEPGGPSLLALWEMPLLPPE
jgi:hypothetical protein